MQERFPDAIYYDLLIDSVRKAFKRNPDSFREALLAKPDGTLVIADEIQKVPELLDAVYWLMVNRGLHFILSGSSARKLKKSGANTLGGRANPRTLFPLVWKEVTDFQIDKAVQNTMTKKTAAEHQRPESPRQISTRNSIPPRTQQIKRIQRSEVYIKETSPACTT